MSESLLAKVTWAVDRAPVVDLHTHLFAPEFGTMNLWGIDELLTYHYLVAETLRGAPYVTPEEFYARSTPEQADLVWRTLFVGQTPLSEATAGVVSAMTAFGLDPRAPDLREARAFFSSRSADQHLDEVLELSGVRSLVMTNDPLDPAERVHWDAGKTPDSRFRAALRIDPIVNSWWQFGSPKLVSEGYGMTGPRRFFDDWIKRMKPVYLAVSLPDTFMYPEESDRVRLLQRAVLPACRDHGLPLALMIGVRRAVNPRLRGAGDGMGVADLSSLERLAADHPENRFLVTTLAKENAHGLCVVARKFANVLPFGCWWFMNNPSLVEETTLMRLEMLGPTFVPQHSDARILDQLIYKWRHSRRSIAAALTKRYLAMPEMGEPSREAIDRHARALMGGIAADWLGIEHQG